MSKKARELRFSGSAGSLGWEELLAKRRVVVLAEAGSGKTEELKNICARQSQAGEFARTGEELAKGIPTVVARQQQSRCGYNEGVVI